MSERLKSGTKVLVHDKTYGCPIRNVMERRIKSYDPLSEVPFEAWVKEIHDSRSNIYVLVYRKGASGGDYYRREDFEIVGCRHFFEDKEFLM